MMRRLGSIRLLPITIFALASLLAVKSTHLVRAAAPAHDTSAKVTTPTEAATPATKQPPPPVADAPKPSEEAAPAVTDGERTLLLELRQRRVELDARDAAAASRENLLAAAEQKLSARVGELQALQKKLEALEISRKEHEDTSWQGLVKLYEVMKPREAATIFNDLEMPVLLQVVDRMKEAKAAPVLAAMQPDKARDLTARLAQLRTQRNGPVGG